MKAETLRVTQPAVGRAKLRIGVDFDNTIVRYDDVFGRIAREMQLVGAGFSGDKAALRAHVRALENGEWQWTTMQAKAYGPGLSDASPFEGVGPFFERCRAAGIPLAIVSHKSEFAAADPHGVNLRDAAREWLAAHGFTGESNAAAAVYFESTRAEKVARIRQLACSHFIDDLEEVFLEPGFPAEVQRLLFAPDVRREVSGPFSVARSWAEIATKIFC